MTRDVWILPVGLEYDRVLESLKQGGREFHIIFSASRDTVSESSEKFATKIRDYLQSGPFIVKSFQGVDVLDLPACIRLLKKIVAEERGEGGDEPRFLVNIGTSSKIVTLASLYVAALEPEHFELYYPRAKDYIVLEIVERAEKVAAQFGKGKVSKTQLAELAQTIERYHRSGSTSKHKTGYDLVSIPVIPLQKLSKTQETILRILNDAPEPFQSSSNLAELLFREGEVTGPRLVEGARSTVSFALQALVKWNLAQQRQVGKRKEISITESGRLYCEVFLKGPRRNIREMAVPGSGTV